MHNRPPTSSRTNISRRTFVKASAAALAFPTIVPASALGKDGHVAPSNRIVMGFIGVGSRGHGDMRVLLGRNETQFAAVCDVNRNHVERSKNEVEKRQGAGTCEAYRDFRDLLARDDIDAVGIGTPDHWHAIIAIAACKAGKDVFCEKPLSLTVREGRAMVEATRRYGRIFSCGSQRVLGDHSRIHRIVRGGVIGKPLEAKINIGPPPWRCHLPAEPAPDHLDWDMWLGPAPDAPYHPYRVSRAYNVSGKGWRSWRDYSGGMMTDWGGHIFGAAVFALDMTHAGPRRITPPDGKDYEFLTYEFDNGVRMMHTPGKIRGRLYIRGTEGDTASAQPPRYPVKMPGYQGSGGLAGDFLAAVKSRIKPFRDVEIAHRTATVCHLGNIAYELNRPLEWDPKAERFVNDPEADRLLYRPYRGEWTL